MTVGMLARIEGIAVGVDGFFKMERGWEAVVSMVPREGGMAAMKSLPYESDLGVERLRTLVELIRAQAGAAQTSVVELVRDSLVEGDMVGVGADGEYMSFSIWRRHGLGWWMPERCQGLRHSAGQGAGVPGGLP